MRVMQRLLVLFVCLFSVGMRAQAEGRYFVDSAKSGGCDDGLCGGW